MQRRVTLIADEGMILTNGKQYAKVTHLAVDANEYEWYQIPESEYEQIMEQQRKSMYDPVLLGSI